MHILGIIKEKNYIKNKEISALMRSGEMICGQALGNVAKMRYGLCPMSFNGCEVIAVYNALCWLGKPQPLCEVAAYMEKYRVLLGFFGGNAYSLGRALSQFGEVRRRTSSPDGAKAFIITFWTGLPLLSSIHTVFCVKGTGGVSIYNSSNSCPNVRTYKDITDYIGRHRPIAVDIIRD